MQAPVPVTYLFNRDCPSHEEGRLLLDRAAAAAGVPIAVTAREVGDDDEARSLRFPGSPTYLVAGRDLAPAPDGVPFAAANCRAYVRGDGRVGPLPDLSQLVEALVGARPEEDP